jgi:hypothetical protein
MGFRSQSVSAMKNDLMSSKAARAILVGLFAPALAMILFLLLNLTSVLLTKKEWIRQSTRQAFLEGSLSEQYESPYDRKNGYNQFNDCLIIVMLLSDYRTNIQEAISPRKNEGNPCRQAQMLAGLQASLGSSTETQGPFYHRYLHGTRAVSGLLLSNFNIAHSRLIIQALGYLILALCALLALYRVLTGLATKDLNIQRAGLFFLLMSLMLMFFYGIEFFGMSLGFGVSDMSVYTILLFLIVVDVGRMSKYLLGAVCVIFGAVTAYLEFLTGQAPLALSLILGAIVVSSPERSRALDVWQTMLIAIFCFAYGVTACFAIKIAVAGAVFGYEEITSALSVFTSRMGAGLGNEGAWYVQDAAQIGLDISGEHVHSTSAVIYLSVLLYRVIPVIGQGSNVVATSLLVASSIGIVAAIVWILLIRNRAKAHCYFLPLLASAAVVPAWYLVFLNHSIIHTSFMVRPLVYVVALGLWLGTTVLLDLRKELRYQRATSVV